MFDMPNEYLKCGFEAGLNFAGSRRATGRALVDSPWRLPGEFAMDRA
ncbi:MAG: hypothetical protein AB1750_12380 [Chloroflexota bacterium]